MATLVDDVQTSRRGSYFDVLTEKYPDLAPPPDDPIRPVADPTAVSESGIVDDSKLDAEIVESSWLATTLLVILALALIFPPALLWRPSWLPSEGVVASFADEPSASAEGVSVPTVDAIVATASNSGPQELKPADAADGDAADGFPTDVVVDTSISPFVDPPATVESKQWGTKSGTLAESVASSTPPPVAALVAAALVAEIPESSGHSEASRGSVSKKSPSLLEVSTAGPRIEPARRLTGSPPELRNASSQSVRVRMRTHIDPRGEVIGVDVLQGLSETEDRLLAESLRQWRYAPATVDGRFVSSQQEVVFVIPPAGVAQLAENEPVEPARRRSSPLPGYTTEAWVQGTEGEVELLASIDSQGEVTEVEVLQGLPHGLTQSAVAAVERWKFDPARRQGEAVASTQRFRLRFAL